MALETHHKDECIKADAAVEAEGEPSVKGKKQRRRGGKAKQRMKKPLGMSDVTDDAGLQSKPLGLGPGAELDAEPRGLPLQDIEEMPCALRMGLLACSDCQLSLQGKKCDRKLAIARALDENLKPDVSCTFTFASTDSMRDGTSQVALHNLRSLVRQLDERQLDDRAADPVQLVKRAELAVAAQNEQGGSETEATFDESTSPTPPGRETEATFESTSDESTSHTPPGRPGVQRVRACPQLRSAQKAAKLAQARASEIEAELREVSIGQVAAPEAAVDREEPARAEAAVLPTEGRALALQTEERPEKGCGGILACADCSECDTCELRLRIEGELHNHPKPNVACSFMVAASDSMVEGLGVLVTRNLRALLDKQRLLHEAHAEEEEALACVSSFERELRAERQELQAACEASVRREARARTLHAELRRELQRMHERSQNSSSSSVAGRVEADDASREEQALSTEEQLQACRTLLARVCKSRDEASLRATTLEDRLRESQHAHAAAAVANVQAMRHAVDMERWFLQQQQLALDEQQRRHAEELTRRAAVLSQASFYFSPANLQHDEYLRSHMQLGTGFVPLRVLLSFPRMSRRAPPPDGVRVRVRVRVRVSLPGVRASLPPRRVCSLP